MVVVKKKENPPILKNGQFATPTDTLPDGLAEEAAPTAAESGAAASEQAPGMIASPDIGGLADILKGRREAAQKRRDDAYTRWQERLKDADDYMESFARQLKPADTTKEQRNLRTFAAMQAFGELLGTAIGGAIGFGRKGQGYVPRMPGLARNTLDRLEKLRQQGVLAEEEYRRRTSGIMSELAQNKARRAEQEYKAAEDDLRNMDKLDDYALRQAVAMGYREPYAQRRQEERVKLEGVRQGNREQIEQKRQSGRVTLKQISSGRGSGKGPLPGKVAEIKEWLLPKTKTTIRDNGRGETTVTTPYTSYPKQLDAAVEARAWRLEPIVNKYGLSKSETVLLDGIMQEAPDMATWEEIENALAEGFTVQEIAKQIK